MKLITVTMVLDVDTNSDAYDAVNELLRELQRTYVEESCLIDYAVDAPKPCSLSPDNYVEGSAFA
jgi:hypothetical protein